MKVYHVPATGFVAGENSLRVRGRPFRLVPFGLSGSSGSLGSVRFVRFIRFVWFRPIRPVPLVPFGSTFGSCWRGSLGISRGVPVSLTRVLSALEGEDALLFRSWAEGMKRWK